MNRARDGVHRMGGDVVQTPAQMMRCKMDTEFSYSMGWLVPRLRGDGVQMRDTIRYKWSLTWQALLNTTVVVYIAILHLMYLINNYIATDVIFTLRILYYQPVCIQEK